MREYRFVACIDLTAESLEKAYAILHGALKELEWESSDEAYEDGEEIPPEDLQQARMAFFDKQEKIA